MEEEVEEEAVLRARGGLLSPATVLYTGSGTGGGSEAVAASGARLAALVGDGGGTLLVAVVLLGRFALSRLVLLFSLL